MEYAGEIVNRAITEAWGMSYTLAGRKNVKNAVTVCMCHPHNRIKWKYAFLKVYSKISVFTIYRYTLHLSNGHLEN